MLRRLDISVIAIVLTIALLSCGCATESVTTTAAARTTTTTAPPTTTTAQVTTTTARATTTTAAMTTTTTEALTVLKWDSTAEVDGLRIIVSEPRRDTNLYAEDAQGRRSDATLQVLGVKVILENVSDTPHIYSAGYFVLADSEGNTYLGYDQDESSYGEHVAMRSGYLDPGKKITRWLNYGVPRDAAAEGVWYSKDGTFGTNLQAIWES